MLCGHLSVRTQRDMAEGCIYGLFVLNAAKSYR